MKDENKTKRQLVLETQELRRRLAVMEAAGAAPLVQPCAQELRPLLELTAVYRASQRLQQLLTPATLAQEIIGVLEEVLAYEYGSVLLIDGETGRLIPFAVSDQGQGPDFVAMDKVVIASHGFRLGKGITGWVAEHGQSVRVGDVLHDARYQAVREGIQSELCVPLRIGDQLLGVVNVETTRANAYTEVDQRVLETVAAQMAVALQNARLYEQVQLHARALEERVAERTSDLMSANTQLRQEADERKRVEAEIQRRLQETTLMYRLSTLIASAPGISEALHAVCAELAHFLDVPQAGFASMNAEQTAAEVIADFRPPGSSSALGAVIPVPDNPSMTHVIKYRVPLAGE